MVFWARMRYSSDPRMWSFKVGSTLGRTCPKVALTKRWLKVVKVVSKRSLFIGMLEKIMSVLEDWSLFRLYQVWECLLAAIARSVRSCCSSSRCSFPVVLVFLI